MRLATFIFLMGLLLLESCVERLDFDLQNQASDILVVEGFITNELGPHQIRLAYSAPFKDIDEGGKEIPISGANVSIIDELGTVISLEDQGDGIYTTSETFQGVVDKEYQLRVSLEDGKEYLSTAQVLPASGTVDSIYFAYNGREVLKNGSIVEEFGVEGWVDYSFIDEHSYFLWEWEGVFSFETLNNLCYVYEESRGYALLSDNEETTAKTIKEASIMFEEPDFRFFGKFNFRAVQYSTTIELYEYFELIDQQSNSTGSVFDPTPATITGNIYNMNNPDELVLGYFGAFGVSDKRIFITNDDIPEEILDPKELCALAERPPMYCSDCIHYPNASYTEPDFWE